MKEVKTVTSVLLPLEEYKRLTTQQQICKSGETLKNTQINKIADTKLNIKTKTRKTKQIISRKKVNEQLKKPTIVINPKIAILTKLREQRRRKIQNIIKNTPTYNPKQIMEHITVNKPKIAKVVDWLLTNQKVISWNRYNTLILYGTPIPDADILGIFRNLFKHKENPNKISGAVAFYTALNEVGFPLDMIQNQYGKQLLKEKNN